MQDPCGTARHASERSRIIIFLSLTLPLGKASLPVRLDSAPAARSTRCEQRTCRAKEQGEIAPCVIAAKAVGFRDGFARGCNAVARPVSVHCDRSHEEGTREDRVPPFRAAYAPPDEEIAARLLAPPAASPEAEARIDAPRRRAGRGDPRPRRRRRRHRGFPARLFALHQGGPRPDGARRSAAARARRRHRRPADRGQARRRAISPLTRCSSGALLVSASAWALGISARIIDPGETPETHPHELVSRLGPAGGAHRDPPGDAAARLAFRARPDHRRGARARRERIREFRYSFDMLGEGARTAADAERYFPAYADAIEAIGAARRQRGAAGAARHLGQALGAASALRGGVARTRAGRARAAGHRSRAQAAQSPRPQLHRRRRGSRPAGTLARRDRRAAGRSVARRLGRLRPRGAGLSEARAGGDRLAGRRRAGARPPR